MRLAALFGLLLMVGCGDSVTLPEAGQASANLTAVAAPDEDHDAPACCDPIIVIVKGPEECDKYVSLSCPGEGDDCMYSTGEFDTTFGCLPPGGGGPGGGGTPPSCPTWDPNYPACQSGPPPPTGGCDPRYDPGCHQPLTGPDSTTLRTAKQLHRKPASQFTDPAKAQFCAQLANEFDRLFGAGKVFRGSSVTPPNDKKTPAHVALYYRTTGEMHFEPDVLDRANNGDAAAIRSIYNSALHEAAHSLGFPDHSDPLWSGDYDFYAESPYDLLSPGANSCIANW
jgi:hypothetical protein